MAFFFTTNPFHILKSTPLPIHSSDTYEASTSSLLQLLSPLKREEIQAALTGDTSLMISLIKEWDLDGQILQEHAIPKIRRLLRSERVRVYTYSDQKKALTHPPKLLPQTFVAASFLLALTSNENIVALPHGLRAQTDLYPESLTNCIPLEIDRYQAEALYKTKPTLAFVADYSDPAILQAFAYQGIPLVTLDSIETVEEIESTICMMGDLIGCSDKAFLLSMFIKAAMFAIDNRLLLVNPSEQKTMILNYFAHFSAPTTKTINGDLLIRLKKLGYSLLPNQQEPAQEWSIPVSEEEIIAHNPDCIIITSSAPEALKKHIQTHPALQQLKATKKGNIYCLEGNPHAPTQYIVLAYFDIFQALQAAYQAPLKKSL